MALFRKKPKVKPPGREVHKNSSAPVFSYYSSRGSASGTEPTVRSRQRQSQQPKAVSERKQRIRAQNMFHYTPTIFAGVTIVFCALYVTTLGTQPNVIVAGDDNRSALKSTELYESEIEKLLGRSIVNRSKLLVDTNKIAADIREAFPELDDVSVILPLVGRKPIVEITPARPALILSTGSATYILDGSGRAILNARDAASSLRDNVPVLEDQSGVELTLGKHALPTETVRFVQEVSGQLARAKIRIQSFVLPSTPHELQVRSQDDSYFVRYQVKGEGRLQAGTYLATRDKLKADGVTPREYMDVRVAGKVYYK